MPGLFSMRVDPDRNLRLRRPDRLSPWGNILLRGGLVLGLILIALIGHWLHRESLSDGFDGEVSFVDIIYFTAVTITTVGYGDITPTSEGARLFDALVVTPIRLFIWLLFIGTAYNFVVRRSWEQWRMRSVQKSLDNHIIVAGYGTTGSAAVHELVENGLDPEDILVIDPNESALESALGVGCITLHGDATRNATLRMAAIEKARSFIACGGRDDTSALLVMSARQLNEELSISAIIKSEENEFLVKKAGADTVINPVALGGHMLARAATGTHVVDYIQDLVVASGRVQLIERPAELAEVGGPLSQCNGGLAVRIVRDGRYIGFWEDDAQRLEEGDMIVEIVPVSGDMRDKSRLDQ
ncbi:potassium transporter TrkA [Pacificimonas flava]|uniref:Potassium transporter TrkA n=3 Tax=Sphingosinicellaceae TaxID=2820280 RepID=A0A219B3K3_9SPHN|nr:potassium channel family protein [Pacificimonas aurantium]OWV32962.1 potassium transporter TrkA [Pacificimonas flava]